MQFLRMRPGHGEQLIAEGDVEVAADEQRLVEEFRRQLDEGMWAAVPITSQAGRREAAMVHAFNEIPRDTDRVIFFPRAAGGARRCPAEPADPMTAALIACSIVVIALLWETTIPWIERRGAALRARREARGHGAPAYDPGRERRAEQRARELLRS